ncbi:sulfatase-like hydrolase/transferase [Caenimonas terrae]|uniref:Sulfatase-like hydrolase/transferase n=1 Tax=Caenimonas terrae TaxID=696074 RepID=A0ABW0NI12_9BURK
MPLRVPAAYFLAFFLIGFVHWLGASVGNPTIDAILYHWHYSTGINFTFTRIFFLTFIAECIAFPLLLAVGATFLQALVQRLMRRGPAPGRWGLAVAPSALAICCGIMVVMLKLSVVSWIGYKLGPDHFASEYMDPDKAVLRPGHLKNLLLVYVESLEESYGDAGVWGRDLLTPLQHVGGVSFRNYRTTPGSSWTIAAMVATQCGVPLRFVQTDMNQQNPQLRVFLPGAVCLGDILHRFGYRNVFMGGAPLSFSGKRQFLQDHHFDATYGRTEWLKEGIAPGSFNEWGLYDDELLRQARKRLVELHDSAQPFNLTVLTLDTHNPYGYRSPTCRARGIKTFVDIVECTTGQVAELVKFATDKGYLKDTQIIVIGDHLAKSNPVADTLDEIPDRRIFNRFVSENMPQQNTDDIMPFDLFPSIVQLLGIDVPGDRLGLGYTAFAARHVARPASRKAGLGFPSLSGSREYERLWSQP